MYTLTRCQIESFALLNFFFQREDCFIGTIIILKCYQTTPKCFRTISLLQLLTIYIYIIQENYALFAAWYEHVPNRQQTDWLIK